LQESGLVLGKRLKIIDAINVHVLIGASVDPYNNGLIGPGGDPV